MKRLTLKMVNAALAARGIPERLVQGNGYLYFIEGDASSWYSSSVAVCRLNHLPTIQQWVDEHRALATDWKNWDGLTKEQYDAKYGVAAVMSSKDLLRVARERAKAAGFTGKNFKRTAEVK